MRPVNDKAPRLMSTIDSGQQEGSPDVYDGKGILPRVAGVGSCQQREHDMV